MYFRLRMILMRLHVAHFGQIFREVLKDSGFQFLLKTVFNFSIKKFILVLWGHAMLFGEFCNSEKCRLIHCLLQIQWKVVWNSHNRLLSITRQRNIWQIWDMFWQPFDHFQMGLFVCFWGSILLEGGVWCDQPKGKEYWEDGASWRYESCGEKKTWQKSCWVACYGVHHWNHSTDLKLILTSVGKVDYCNWTNVCIKWY